MPWGRLDDSLYDHPKLDELGRDRLPCVGLWTVCISWSNRQLTDGYVPAERIVRLGGTPHLAARLVQVGLFEVAPDGFLIHDFLAFNKSRAQVSREREAARSRYFARTSPELRAKSGGSSEELRVPRPIRTNPYPSRPPEVVVVDEREWTEEQRQTAYAESMKKRTGVEA